MVSKKSFLVLLFFDLSVCQSYANRSKTVRQISTRFIIVDNYVHIINSNKEHFYKDINMLSTGYKQFSVDNYRLVPLFFS